MPQSIDACQLILPMQLFHCVKKKCTLASDHSRTCLDLQQLSARSASVEAQTPIGMVPEPSQTCNATHVDSNFPSLGPRSREVSRRVDVGFLPQFSQSYVV